MEATASSNYIAKEDDHSMKFQLHYFNSVTLYVLIKPWNIYTERHIQHIIFLILWTLKEKAMMHTNPSFRLFLELSAKYKNHLKFPMSSTTLSLFLENISVILLFIRHTTVSQFMQNSTVLLQAEQFLELPKFVYSQGRLHTVMLRK